MADVNILVLADHAEILETIIRLINKNEGWRGTGVAGYDQAEEALKTNKFDLVLLGVGVDDEAEARILRLCESIAPQTVCMRHYGGGSGLLSSEIQHALAQR
ncbi:response regulator receiver protein [Dyadobacter chenwenxiniae]|uniref:Response regulator receiver protein n=1 Tax=Dyadobacter chenwenxiniae TaxID=2906456 RepID=A0A9X1PFG5_9BACT|nr:response regulator receiver protein [Dyadobacter chenwenxiniae]MCF0060167.1 response regulator receiver protein [Dyadobacter chenwenxiniae]UON85904.1 response regulator receiver protein [Dyadobacter chenwenxiniae]